MDLFKSSEFSKHVSELMEEWHIPGVAIAVVDHDQVASHGYGYASLHEQTKIPMTADSVFDIASSSKSMTAGAVALLVEDEEQYPNVQWDTPVSKLLPEDFVMEKEEYTKGITVEDILSHRTGLPRHDFSYLSPRAATPDTPRSITRNLRNLEISAPIRSKFMYNNIMFTVAAYLVEQLSGLSFDEFLRQHFWKPLEMDSTNIQSKNAISAGLPVVQPYIWRDETKEYVAVERQDSPEAVGAGLIVTSVNDYIKWIKALINRTSPVSHEVYKGMTKPRSISSDGDVGELEAFTSHDLYAAGLGTCFYRGHQCVNHDGGDPGVASKIFFLPQFKFGAVLFGNSGDADRVFEVVSRELIDEALAVPRSERRDWVAWEREMIAKNDKEEEDEKMERRRKLCPETESTDNSQETSLSTYTGRYWNAGYHAIQVETNQDNKLVIDMTDRTMGFTIEFEHICNQTKYIAHTIDYYEGVEREMAAEFRFDGSEVTRLGLELEEDLEGGLIWFHKAS